MKGSTFFWITGGAIAVGAVAYGVYRYFQSQGNTTTKNAPEDNGDGSTAPVETYNDTPQCETIVSDFEQTQQDTFVSIKKHHQEAAQQLENTLGEMAQDNIEFEKAINQVNDDLDKLLK